MSACVTICELMTVRVFVDGKMSAMRVGHYRADFWAVPVSALKLVSAAESVE